MKRLLITLSFFPTILCAYDTPTMGWSSWNTFAVNISESLIKGQADAMVSKGLADVGYNYINIDDGFQNGRDTKGNIRWNTTRFPRGLKVVADYIHSKGLKAGIYSDAGDLTCGSISNGEVNSKNVGLYGHEQQDADFYFKTCGYDFIKVDYCGGSHLALDEEEQYTKIYQAIVNTGCDVRYNLCRWAFPGTWAHEVSTSWRTTGDIYAAWESVRGILSENMYLSAYCYGGCYNDMDMLEVGRGLTREEDRTHFGMWCIMSSPLLIGCDMRNLKGETLELLMNTELIALNQDPLGIQAYVVQHQGGTYVMVKDVETLFGTRRAVALYNPNDKDVLMSVSLGELDLAGETQVRDLFEHQDLPSVTEAVTVQVPAHGTRIYLLEANERLERYQYEAETAYLSCYQEVRNNSISGQETAVYQSHGSCSGGHKVGWLGGRAENDLQWRNVYSMDGGEYEMTLRLATKDNRDLTVQVNGADVSTLTANTGSYDTFKDFKVTINLNKGMNVVRLYNSSAFMPDVDYMRLQAKQGESILVRQLRDACNCLRALAAAHPLTSTLQKNIASLLTSASAETLTDTQRNSYISRCNTFLKTIAEIMPAVDDYNHWHSVAESYVQVSKESTALTTLQTKLKSTDRTLSSATTAANVVSATATLQTAIKAYLLAATSYPLPGQELDMTLLVTNADFSTQDGWQGSTPTYRSGCGEFFRVTFDMYQILSNMKPGRYAIRCNALYRAKGNDGGTAYRNGTEVIPAVLYANAESVALKSLYSEEWPEASDYGSVDALNGYPHSMHAAEVRFSQGCYPNEVIVTLEEKGNIRFGLCSEKKTDDNWCCFDNFTISYLGLPEDEDALPQVFGTERPAFGNNTPSAVYDLSGRKVTSRHKGIIVKNKAKVLQ